MASRPYGVLYIGVTSNLVKRVYEHKNNLIFGFTAKYFVHLLVWFGAAPLVQAAITMEGQIKEWKREWKIELINKINSVWKDLYSTLV